MPLDVAILGEDGSPASSVSIPLNAHGRMIDEAEAAKLPMLMRLSDYWGDAKFDIGELRALRDELEQLMLKMSEDKEVESLARALIHLVDLAAEKKTEVLALAD